MGLKRVVAQFDAVFPQDDTRTLDELTGVVADALGPAVVAAGGAVEQVTILSASADADPVAVETLSSGPR